MRSEKNVESKRNISSYQNLEERKNDKPNRVLRTKNAEIYNDLAEDFGDVLGDGFHGLNDDYYYDEDDI